MREFRVYQQSVKYYKNKKRTKKNKTKKKKNKKLTGRPLSVPTPSPPSSHLPCPDIHQTAYVGTRGATQSRPQIVGASVGEAVLHQIVVDTYSAWDLDVHTVCILNNSNHSTRVKEETHLIHKKFETLAIIGSNAASLGLSPLITSPPPPV